MTIDEIIKWLEDQDKTKPLYLFDGENNLVYDMGRFHNPME